MRPRSHAERVTRVARPLAFEPLQHASGSIRGLESKRGRSVVEHRTAPDPPLDSAERGLAMKATHTYKSRMDASAEAKLTGFLRTMRSRRRSHGAKYETDPDDARVRTIHQLDRKFSRIGYRCYWCSGPFEQIDHVNPVSRGGRDTLDNLVPSCSDCNGSKGAMRPKAWYSIVREAKARGVKPSVVAQERGPVRMRSCTVKSCERVVISQSLCETHLVEQNYPGGVA